MMVFCQHRIAIALAAAAVVLMNGLIGFAQESRVDGNIPQSVKVGFAGHSRLGAWFPVFVTPDPEASPIRDIVRYEIDTIDGDGSPYTIAGNVARRDADVATFECLMQSGRRYGERRVRLLDSLDAVVYEESFRVDERGQGRIAHASTTALTAVVESDGVLTAALSRGAARNDESTFVVGLDAVADFPSRWLSLQSVEMLFLQGEELALVQSLSDLQLQAIEGWVRNGGQLIIAVGANGDHLLGEGQPLHRFCPGEYVRQDQMASSSRLEFFAGSNEQLIARDGQPIEISRLNDVRGVIELQQDDLPLIVRTSLGFGEIVFVAFDLKNPRVLEWSGLVGVLNKLTNRTENQAARRPRGREQRGNTVSHYGYEDLTGQLRVPLDLFSDVRFISFTWVAILIGLYILCIGPGDWFLLSRWLQKMELTWITFPLIAVLFCSIAWFTSRVARPGTTQMNQLEIIDIDQASGRARGSIWNNLYSPFGDRISLQLPDSNDLEMTLTSKIVGWQGLPGGGLGGMDTRAGASLIDQSWRQDFAADDEHADDPNAWISRQSLRVSSTRAFFNQWWATVPFEINNRLRFTRRIGRLEGTFTNPLDRQIRNCRLLYDSWAYVLPQPLEPGETIDVLTEMKERTARSYFNRRTRASEESNKGQNIPWDPTGTNVSRIAEMLMFHEAAGGTEYTGLTHGYQSFVDLSRQLGLSQAILVGELDQPVTRLQIDEGQSEYQYDSVTTLIRIVIPVEQN